MVKTFVFGERLFCCYPAAFESSKHIFVPPSPMQFGSLNGKLEAERWTITTHEKYDYQKFSFSVK